MFESRQEVELIELAKHLESITKFLLRLNISSDVPALPRPFQKQSVQSENGFINLIST